jgi:hypothetical protein
MEQLAVQGTQRWILQYCRERGILVAYGNAMGILSRKISGLKRRNVKNFIKWITNKKLWPTHFCPPRIH